MPVNSGFDIGSAEFISRLLSSIVLFLAVILLRFAAVQAVRRWKFIDKEMPRRTIVHIKNFTVVLLVLGLLIIWAEELRNFAISLVAVAAALALASKELILCFLGGLYKGFTRPFSIGDRIEVQNFRGDVLDHDFLSTKLFEIGPGHQLHQYTGRTITVPNSVFLQHPVINEDREQYLLHTFSVHLRVTEHWHKVEEALLESARIECKDYIERATRYLEEKSQRESIDVPNAEPRVSVYFPEAETMTFTVRLPTPGLRKGRIEQAVIRRFLDSVTISDIVPQVSSH